MSTPTAERNAELVTDHWTGTHVGTWEGIDSIPATGATVRVNGIGMFTVADGQIEEVWYMQDEWGLEHQLTEASE